MSRIAKTVFILLICLYFLTRLYKLTLLPIFTDEAVYIHLSKIVSTGQQFFIALVNGKPPLLTWITASVLAITPDEDFLFFSRLVIVFIGLFGVIGIYKLSFVLFKSEKIGLLTTFLYILAPFILFYDRLFLFDSFLSVASIWVFYFAFKSANSLNLKDALLWGGCLAIAFNTKPPAVFIWLLSLGAFFAFTKRINKHIILLAVTASLIGQFFNNILRFSSGYPYYVKLTNSYSIFDAGESFDIFQTFFTNVISTFGWINSYYTSIILYLGIIGFVLLILDKKRLGLILIILWIAPLAIFCAIAEIYLPRYILFTTPYFLVVVGYLLVKLNKYIASGIMGIALLFLLNFDFLLIANPYAAPLPIVEKDQYVTKMASGYGLEPIINYLKHESRKKPIKVVVSGSLSNFPSAFVLEFWRDKNIELNADWNEKKEPSGTYAAIRSRKSNFHKDIIEELKLKVILKGEKPGGKEPFYLTVF